MDKNKSNLKDNPYPGPGKGDVEQPEFIDPSPVKKDDQAAADIENKKKNLHETDLEKDDPATIEHEPDNSN
ncbi:MAG: hypothetical protein H7Y27_09220 [Gemmatimonadaceae bacterium]|nr:hypothetical protein [Chitinophagaceae bacterium]